MVCRFSKMLNGFQHDFSPRQPALRYATWLGGAMWFLSWFTFYLEVYRYHHLAAPLIGGAAVGFGPGASPGAFLRTVVVISVIAPLFVGVLLLWRRASSSRRSEARRREPRFPITKAVVAFGATLCVLGVINQLVRRPPIEVDLTLRAGNGGFVVLGAAMVFVALFSRVARNR